MDFKKGDILYYKEDYLKNIKKLLKESQKEKNVFLQDYANDMIYNVYTVEAIEGHRIGLKKFRRHYFISHRNNLQNSLRRRNKDG